MSPPLESVPDAVLVARWKEGDREALAALYCRHDRLIRRVIARVFRHKPAVRGAVEEVASDFWHRMLTDRRGGLHAYDAGRSLEPFLAALACREALVWLRRRRQQLDRVHVSLQEGYGPRAAGAGTEAEQADCLEALMCQLTPQERRFLQEFLLAPAGEDRNLGFSSGYVWQLAKRVRDKLCRLLEWRIRGQRQRSA